MKQIVIRTPPTSLTASWVERVHDAWQQSVQAVIETGRLLAEAKATLPHGEFGAMIETQLPFCARTAQCLMKITGDKRIRNSVSHLPPHWGTLHELTKLSDEQFEARIADGTIRPDVERNVVAALTAKRNAVSRRQLATELSDTSANMPVGRKFPVIYADPAWSRKAGIGNRAYENSFPTMGWDGICDLPVAQLALPDAWLFFWIPRAHLLAPTFMPYIEDGVPSGQIDVPLSWRVAQSWGFPKYSTCFVWTKTDELVPDDHGLGLIAWDQDELLLLFKRGNGLPKPDTDIKFGSNHRERPREHSRKPNFYRHMIRAMAGEGVPVLELFARKDPANPWPADWHAWGNQDGASEAAIDESFDPITGEITDGAPQMGAVTEPAPESDPAMGAGHPSVDKFEIPGFLKRTA